MGTANIWHYYVGFMGASFFWTVLAWLVSAFLTGYVAKEKGYPFLIWLIGGLLFPGITLLAAVGLPVRTLFQPQQKEPINTPTHTTEPVEKNEPYITVDKI
ncbi:hypothetical protein ACBP46_07165 [Paenalcaligenes hominis]|uniref:hypothetical protein n=1 Tax=Paenalcaligenes hominis TaxID=643674 RepID=UPI003524C5A4